MNITRSDQIATRTEVDFEKFYRHFGLGLWTRGHNLVADCPFCGKRDHFEIRKDSGVYNCLVCGKSGNTWEFMNDFHTECLPRTMWEDYNILAANRGLDPNTLMAAKLARSILNDSWLIPSFSQKGRISNLYQAFPVFPPIAPLPPGKVRRPVRCKYEIRSSPSPCQQQLYGIDLLKDQKTIFITEGHWDRLVMWEMLANLEAKLPLKLDDLALTWELEERSTPDYHNEIMKQVCILGVPGANIFKAEWTKHLKNRHVILAYDNDAAGKQGVKKVIRELTDCGVVPLSFLVLVWEKEDPKDVRDVCLKK